MSIIQTSSYADFKLVAATQHYKDIFYFNSTGIFVIYATTSDGFTLNSGNLGTQPASFATDFPDAIAIASTLTLS